MMNGKKPLTLNFNTFTTSTGLDYNNGAYVDHPSLKVVKAELSNIITNPSYLDKNPILKNSFPVAWRILLTFMIQEVLLGLEYTQDEKFRYLPGIMSNFNFSKDPSKVTEIELTAYMIVVNNQKDLVSLLPLSTKKKKWKSQTVTTTLPKLKGNDQPVDKGLPSIASNEGTTKTTPRPEEPLGDKDSGGNKPPADMKLINPTVADPSGTSAKYQGVFEAGEDMDEDTQEDTEVQSLPQNAKKPESSHVQDTNESTLTLVLISKKVVVSYADLKASIEGYYEENIDHKEQTDKVIDAAMNSLDKNGIARGDLLNALNGVTEALKAIQDTVKEDHVLNKKVLEDTEAYTKNSTHLTELLTLIKNFDF
ncbi:hypothetical protein Tco_0636152 [Tanacetum coccineum]